METSHPCDLSVIVVNYNTADCLARCLNSVKSQSGVNAEVIVADNASRDGSQDLVRNEFPWVHLIANGENLGFAKANNQALKLCKGRYTYFLNPDTEVGPGTFRTMIDFMDSNAEVGLAGTKIVNPDGSLQPSVGRRYPGAKYAKHELKGLPGDIACVLGASMVARRDLVSRLGGFDESFFLYGEDQDLCLRVRKAGFAIDYIPEAVVVHWGGQSEKNNLPQDVWKKKFEAELIFYDKHYTKRTIRAIRRENLVLAHWRILSLRIALPFSRSRGTDLAKLQKYRVILGTFR